MGDWIDSLKLQQEQAALIQARTEDLRLHNARIIHGKAQGFFALILERIKLDCEKMQATFPNDNRYHPFINEERPTGFTLNGGKLPRRILGLDLNVNAHQIDMCLRIKHSREEMPFPQALSPIHITVGSEEELQFSFQDKVHDTPESLSQHLVSYVCGI